MKLPTKPSYVIVTHQGEDGWCDSSGHYTSRRKAGKALFARDFYIGACPSPVSRASRRRGPRGFIRMVSVEEQTQMIRQWCSEVF